MRAVTRTSSPAGVRPPWLEHELVLERVTDWRLGNRRNNVTRATSGAENVAFRVQRRRSRRTLNVWGTELGVRRNEPFAAAER